MGGRISEEIFFNIITTGAHDDIEKTTILVDNYINTYGMNNELGFINYKKLKVISNEKRKQIDNNIDEIINKCYEFTKNKIIENKDKIHELAKILLEKETLVLEDIEKIIPSDIKNTEKFNLLK